MVSLSGLKIAGIFLGLILGSISAPSQLKNEKNFSLHIGEKFMKIRTKIGKLQMHENLKKNVNENTFSFTFFFMQIFKSVYEGQLKQQMLYAANFLYAF